MTDTDRPPERRFDAAGFGPLDADQTASGPAPLGEDAKRSVVVQINPDLHARFRAHCAASRTSVTDAVLTAHLELSEAVQRQLTPTAEDQARLELGLPPRSTRSRLGAGKPLSLWLTPRALATLDEAATAAQTTRRRYITTLLTRLLDTTENTPET